MPRIVGEVGARILERGLLVEHAGQRRVQTERRIRTRVAALLHEHHTTLAVPVSQRSSGGAEPAKALHGHALTAVGSNWFASCPQATTRSSGAKPSTIGTTS